jgi:hypothetical protein
MPYCTVKGFIEMGLTSLLKGHSKRVKNLLFQKQIYFSRSNAWEKKSECDVYTKARIQKEGEKMQYFIAVATKTRYCDIV